MSLFPRFLINDIEPMFRAMDDFSSHALRTFGTPTFANGLARRAFQPRFNVKETKSSFELEGEMPGVDQKDVDIEFVDPQTMTVKARSERYSTRSGTPAQLEKGDSGRIEAANEKHHSRQATVEAEGGAAEADTPGTTIATKQDGNNAVANSKAQNQNSNERYWISERSIGEFHRSFNFPTRVDQDKVKASMKNGILSILVPKMTDPVTKKIQIQ